MRTRSAELMERIRAYAEEYIITRGASPSTTDIADSFGIARGTAYKYLVAMREKGLVGYEGGVISTPATEKAENGVCRAALVGSIPCGPLEEEEASVEAYFTLPEAIFGSGDFFILRADGDSMIGAGIEDGDLVVIRRQREAQEGDVVAALVGSESTLKRYFVDREAGCVRLHPENPALEDILVPSCEIQGVARQVIKTVRRETRR